MTSAATALSRAEAAWGADLPDWVRVLAAAADRTSQTQAARTVGYSAATVSYVLSRRYAGDMDRVERAVRAALMGATVACPALGALPLADCLEWQKRAGDFQPTGSRRLLMYRACRACPRLTGETP